MNVRRILKITGKVLLWIVGVWAALVIILQIVLSPSFLTKTANKLVADYVDANVSIGRVSCSTLRHFPNVSLRVDGVTVTYPSDKFPEIQNSARLLRAGTGEEADTLASLGSFSAAVNVAALAAGQIRIPYIGVSAPRLFAKDFGDGGVNWDILKSLSDETVEEETDSTSSFNLPLKIVIDRVSLRDRMTLVYCSVPDTIYATVLLKEINLRLANQKFGGRKKAGEAIAGALPDSLKPRMDSLGRPLDAPDGMPRLGEGPEGHNPNLAPADTEPTPDMIEAFKTRQAQMSERAGEAMREFREAPGESVKEAKKAMRDIGGGGRLSFRVDSLAVGGRMGGDTLSFRMDMLDIHGRGNRIGLRASARANVAMRSLGRVSIPLELRSRFSFLRGGKPGIRISDFIASVADIPFYMDADLRFPGDSIYVKGRFGVKECVVSDLLGYFDQTAFAPLLSQVQTDAKVSLDVSADGHYSSASGSLPAISATLRVPESSLRYELIDSDNKLKLDVTAAMSSKGTTSVSLNELSVYGMGISLAASGSAADLLGRDPLFAFDASVGVSLDTLRPLVRDSLGYIIGGSLDFAAKGSLRQSQMSMARIAEADLSGKLSTPGLVVISPSDSIAMRLDSLEINLYSFENEHPRNPGQDDRLLGLDASLDSLNANYKRSIDIRAADLSMRAMSDGSLVSALDSTSTSADSNAFFPFGGNIKAGLLAMQDKDSQKLGLRGTDNRFSLFPKRDNPSVPMLRLSSNTELLYMVTSDTRAALHSLDMEATAAMNSIERRARARAFLDSLAKANPDVPKDSLRFLLREGRGGHRPPQGLSEDDFRSSDLDLSLDATLAKYFMDWDIEGSIKLERAGLGTPMFPIRNSLEEVDASFNNNEVSVNNFHVSSGSSSLDVGLKISNLRPVLMGRGRLKVDADIVSDSLNANELIAAYLKGQEYIKAETYLDTTSLDAYTDAFEETYVIEDLADTTASLGLIVIPRNLLVNATLDARHIGYSNLSIDTLCAAVKVQDRVAQISGARLVSNMGSMGFEGFYSTKSKEDITAGFDLTMEDITAEDVVALIPAVDSLMPMLTAFKGKLGCTLSATTEIDTLMNFKPATLNGVMRINGQGLTLEDDEAIQKMVKLLMFKNKDSWQIDSMTVEGIVSDSKLEIFPFVLKVDRYTLALSGIQNLDTSFKYHISVIKSPLPFRLGLNIKGNLEKYKFGIGKAKYKSANVPVFTTVIDETRLNLTESIRNVFQRGVDNIIRENEAQSAIQRRKEELNYTAAYDEEMEEISDEEQAELDSYSESEEEESE